MKYLTTTLCFLFITTLTFGQVDMWINQLNTTTGKAKVDLLNKIGETYTDESEPYSAKMYIEQALPLAKKLKYKDGLAIANFFMAETQMLLDDADKAEDYYLAWCKIRKKQGDRQKLIWAMSTVARFYEDQRNDRRVVKTYKKLLKLRKKNKDKTGIKQVYGSLSHYFKGMGKDGSFRPNWKKSEYYLDLYIKAGVETHGESFRKTAIQNYYPLLIYYTMKNNDLASAKRVANSWYKAQAKFLNDKEMNQSVRYIASEFYDRGQIELGNEYTKLALDYAQKMNSVEAYYGALRHTCAVTRFNASYIKSLNYTIQLRDYERANNIEPFSGYEFSTLNAVVANIYTSLDKTIKKEAIQILENWKGSINEKNDPEGLKWVNENISFLSN